MGKILNICQISELSDIRQSVPINIIKLGVMRIIIKMITLINRIHYYEDDRITCEVLTYLSIH